MNGLIVFFLIMVGVISIPAIILTIVAVKCTKKTKASIKKIKTSYDKIKEENIAKKIQRKEDADHKEALLKKYTSYEVPQLKERLLELENEESPDAMEKAIVEQTLATFEREPWLNTLRDIENGELSGLNQYRIRTQEKYRRPFNTSRIIKQTMNGKNIDWDKFDKVFEDMDEMFKKMF